MSLKFVNTYSQLPEIFYSQERPASFPRPELLAINRDLLRELGGGDLLELEEEALARLFSGQDLFSGSVPLAQVYAGHQFGHFNPRLGDGRALLMGEIQAPQGPRFDLQLKGSGQTLYSRQGDGRSPIGPVVREYIVSEAMHALGVPTTRALSAVKTGEHVYREEALPGAVLGRVAKSHLRIGSFQYFLAQGDQSSLKTLVDYAIERHYPTCWESEAPYLEFFRAVSANLNELVASWMSLGFIHGVMNTDNIAISGETLDYGPCAFMEKFKASQVFSFIDRQGRYAYENQPQILQWNLARLAECLIGLVDTNQEKAVAMLTQELESSMESMKEKHRNKMAMKLGLLSPCPDDDKLVSSWLGHLEKAGLDFTNSHVELLKYFEKENPASGPLGGGESFDSFYRLWEERIFLGPKSDPARSKKLMKQMNPTFIPRNHLIEQAIREAEQGETLSTFHRLCDVLKTPYEVPRGYEDFLKPARPDEAIQRTFCGT